MIKKKLGRPAKVAAKPSYRQSEISSLEHQAIGYKAVIDYLEHKLS
jgi:hypothetical protein